MARERRSISSCSTRLSISSSANGLLVISIFSLAAACTTKAARDSQARERLVGLLGLEEVVGSCIYTLHELGLGLLKDSWPACKQQKHAWESVSS